jgi:hypothetical protein
MRETRFVNILIFVALFVSSITLFKEPFEGYIHYVVFVLLLPVFITRFGFSSATFWMLAITLAVGVLQVLMGNNEWGVFFKIWLGVLLSVTFFYGVIHYFRLDFDRIFRFYLRGAVIVAWIGLIQFLSAIVGFKPGYDYSWLLNKWGFIQGGFGSRINSIFSEASQCAIMLAPATFVALLNLFPGTQRYNALSRMNGLLILVVTILTSSSTGYIGLFFSLFLIILNYGRIIYFFVGTFLIISGSIVLYNTVPDFKTRVDTSMALWIDNQLTIENVNSSSFVLYNNFHVASENFKTNFLTGTGLGSHGVAFKKYSLTQSADIIDIDFNSTDGNSLFVRLISETGLIGIIFIFVFIFRHFTRRNDFEPENPAWIISNAVLVLILLYLVRQGNYFLNGLPLFFWMYYYISKQEKTTQFYEEEEEDEETEEQNETEYEEESTDPVH